MSKSLTKPESVVELTKQETNKSHVQEFGDMSISKEPVGDFLGNTPSARNVYYEQLPVRLNYYELAASRISFVVACRYESLWLNEYFFVW